MSRDPGTPVIVIGLGLGDEGKGSIIDYLAAMAVDPVTVVRFNGGAQCAHNVVLDDGTHHTFAQFGSGTFVPGCKTHLSRYMMINPGNFLREEEHLRQIGVGDGFARLTIEEGALITTPFHVAMNHARERARGVDAHGTTGQGIGETMSDSLFNPSLSIRVSDLLEPEKLRKKLEKLRREKYRQAREILGPRLAAPRDLVDRNVIDAVMKEYREFTSRIKIVGPEWLQGILDSSNEQVIFEGAQGVLLDQDVGFHPHTTWSKTTTANALELLCGREAKTLGVLRTYMTRHGAGPLVTDTDSVSGEELHNSDQDTAGLFRVGYLDLVALSYALEVQPVDELAITHLDRLDYEDYAPGGFVCDAYLSKERVGEILRRVFETPEGPKIVTRLKPQLEDDRAAMWAMTHLISEMKPRLVPMKFKDALDALGVSDLVSLVSYGPARSEKKFVRSMAHRR